MGAYTNTDVTITASDGVDLAATLIEPTGVSGPMPAVLMLHALGGKRQEVMEIAQRYADAGFAVLAPDFRGHGESGGLTSIDGPREIQDVRELYAWLAARPEIEPDQIRRHAHHRGHRDADEECRHCECESRQRSGDADVE